MEKIVTIILENEQQEILFYLRDNKSSIPFPHYWDLFGGHVEPGETLEEALKREVQEELGFDLKNFSFFREYECLTGDAFPNVKYVYIGKLDQDISELTLREGERLELFSRAEIPDLKIANILKNIVLDYISSLK